MKNDLEIARESKMEHISVIAQKLGIEEKDLEYYGKYKAKLPLKLIDEEKVKRSKLILVSAITPTPAGEGKTTVSIGLSQGLNLLGSKSTVVLREPSLGPVFGIKGGAAGGRIRTGSSDGRHQSALYRRHFCDRKRRIICSPR